MITKLPKLPKHVWDSPGAGKLYDADQMEAYAREAVADALRPAGDNAEHVNELKSLLRVVYLTTEERDALTAAIAALSQPSVAVTEAMVQRGRVALDSVRSWAGAEDYRLQIVRAVLTAALSQGGKP